MLYNLIVRRTFHNIALLFYISAFFQIYFFFFFFRPRMQILNSYEAKSIYNNLRCLPNGWTRNGSKVFWKYYYYPEYPSLQDIFEDNGYIIVILSTFLIQTHQYQLERMKFYHSKSWALYFHDDKGSIVNPTDPIITKSEPNERYFIMKLRFCIPKKYQNKFNYATIQIILNENESKPIYRPIKKFEPLYEPEYYEQEEEIDGEPRRIKILMKPPKDIEKVDDLSYRKVPFCAIKDKFSFYVNPPKIQQKNRKKEDQLFLSPNGQIKDFLRICTENFIFDEKQKNEEIFRWVLYHIDQGFTKPIIYVNKIESSEKKSFSHFKKLIKLDLIELIYFVFPFSFLLHDQPAQEASCIERNRGRTIWLGHNDVDERFFYLNDKNLSLNLTIKNALKKYTTVSVFEKFSGLKCPNFWMKRLDNDTSLVNKKSDHFYRTKGILFPENVGFYYIHSVSDGKPMLDVNEIINAHFKNITEEYLYCKEMTEINRKLTNIIKKILV